MPPQDQEAPDIVVGVDGSAPAQAALRWAVRQAGHALIAWEYPISLGRFGSARGVPYDDAEFREIAERTAHGPRRPRAEVL
jgi:hypothetical protein